jgi:hypothetical protein
MGGLDTNHPPGPCVQLIRLQLTRLLQWICIVRGLCRRRRVVCPPPLQRSLLIPTYLNKSQRKRKRGKNERRQGAFRLAGPDTLVRKAAWNHSGSGNLRALTKTKMMCLQCTRFLTKSGQVHLNPRQQSPQAQKAQKPKKSGNCS